MSVRPGRTAFLNSVAMYESLSDEDKASVEHSLVEYAPSPYEYSPLEPTLPVLIWVGCR